MTPQEMYDATMAFINRGEEAGFFKICEQLRSGELTMEWGSDGYFIRATTDEEREGDSDS